MLSRPNEAFAAWQEFSVQEQNELRKELEVMVKPIINGYDPEDWDSIDEYLNYQAESTLDALEEYVLEFASQHRKKP